MNRELPLAQAGQLGLLETVEQTEALPKAPKIKKPRKLNNHQIIIGRFVESMRGCYNPSLWKKEGHIVTKLIEKYGLEFLLWCPKPYGKQMPSMAYFLTQDGHEFLSDQLVRFSKQKDGLYEKVEEISLSQDKIGEDIVIQSKPKTLKEFLKYGKTIQNERRGQ